ncbi:hypothetical protein GSH10_18465 [Burkholderia pseudomallei]|nr:hypothetical protein [Burkholderia pseudomallei]
MPRAVHRPGACAATQARRGPNDARRRDASSPGVDARRTRVRRALFWRSIMVAGVVLWVALAVIFPTVVVPAAQHAVERTIKQHDAGASAPGAPRGGTPGQSASPGGGEAIEP